MSNGTPTPPAAPTRDWNKQEDQRAAARDFLQAIIDDTTDALRNKVRSDRPAARAEFEKHGKISIPNDVEVICVEPSTQARAKLVVLTLPEKGDTLASELSSLKYWLAAWIPYSSARFKRNIEAMGDASSTILSLKPVSFRYRRELDPDEFPQFGLIAEEVEKANPDLVLRDGAGKPYGVRYEAINAMLLNEFLKQHRKVQQHEETIALQKGQLTALGNKIEELSRRTSK